MIGLSLSAPPAAGQPLHRLAALAPATADPAASGEERLAATIRRALALGMNLVDSDWITAGGHAQEVLGRVLAAHGRERVLVAGKGGPRLTFRGELTLDNSRGNLLNQAQDSLFRLQTERLDLFQVHWPDGTDPVQTARGLADVVALGRAVQAGVCHYSAGQLQALAALVPLATAQAPLNLLERRFAALPPWCAAEGMGFLAADPTCAGLLAGRFRGDECFAEGDGDGLFATPAFGRACEMARELAAWAAARGLTAVQAAMAWVLAQPGVSCVLCAAQSPAECNEAAAAANVRLSATELRELDAMPARFGL